MKQDLYKSVIHFFKTTFKHINTVSVDFIILFKSTFHDDFFKNDNVFLLRTRRVFYKGVIIPLKMLSPCRDWFRD